MRGIHFLLFGLLPLNVFSARVSPSATVAEQSSPAAQANESMAGV